MAQGITYKGMEKDFLPYKEKVLGILLFGSRAGLEHDKRSDTDICLVAGDYDPDKLFQEVLATNLTAKYDIKIFELLPLKIKGAILDRHKLISSKDPGELSYYLYKQGRRWNDQKIALRKLGLKMWA
jgi:predicted nucleotidyltransferase